MTCSRCRCLVPVNEQIAYGVCENCWADCTAYRLVKGFRITVGREQPTGESQGRGRHHKSSRGRSSLSDNEHLDAMKALLGIQA